MQKRFSLAKLRGVLIVSCVIVAPPDVVALRLKETRSSPLRTFRASVRHQKQIPGRGAK